MQLTAAQLDQYHRDGYLVIPNFFPLSTALDLKREADHLQSTLDFSTHPRNIFRTTDSDNQSTQFSQVEHKEDQSSPSPSDPDQYFLDSADRISFFFEQGAFSPSGDLCVLPSQSINKIGHALHLLNPTFSSFSLTPSILSLTQQLSFHSPILLQSMLIFKHPHIGGLVSKHRDSTFLFTQPSSAVGFWFALEDCTRENGTLSFVKGSHRDGGSDRRLRRVGEKRLTVNNVRREERVGVEGGPRNEGVKLEFTGQDRMVDVYRDDEWTMEEVKAGSLVLIHGDVVHASGHNHSDKSRYIYTFHVVEDEGTVYSPDNWLQSSQLFTHLKDAIKP